MAPAATIGAVAETLPVKSPNISIPPREVDVAGGTVSVAELTLNTVPEICSPEPQCEICRRRCCATRTNNLRIPERLAIFASVIAPAATVGAVATLPV